MSKIPPAFKSAAAPSAAAASTSAPASIAPAPKKKPIPPLAQKALAPAPAAKPVVAGPPAALTSDGLLTRLHYFENLVKQKDGYIDVLKATISRQGGAVPSAYFAPLTQTGAGGSYTPQNG